MKTRKSWIITIERLRKKHTALCKAGKWMKAQTIRDKIITAWIGFEKAPK